MDRHKRNWDYWWFTAAETDYVGPQLNWIRIWRKTKNRRGVKFSVSNWKPYCVVKEHQWVWNLWIDLLYEWTGLYCTKSKTLLKPQVGVPRHPAKNTLSDTPISANEERCPELMKTAKISLTTHWRGKHSASSIARGQLARFLEVWQSLFK